MGWWPFGRKRKSKKLEKPGPPEAQTSVATEKRRAPQPTRDSQERTAQPTNPFSDPTSAEKVPPTSRAPEASQAGLLAQHQFPRPKDPPPEPTDEEITALPRTPRRPQSPRTQPVPAFASNQRVEEPTLVRRKSSKRPRDDKLREHEVRAMTSNFPVPIPKRTGTESKASHVNHPHPDPTSMVSLPAPRSNRSSMTAGSDPHWYDLGAVDILSPRPTLRCSVHGNYASSAIRSSVPSRSDSWREKRPLSRPTIEESDTIDEFADTMDARTVRELMDREQRRRDRKRRTDQDRARRKLDRLAARGEADTEDRRHLSRRKEAEAPAFIDNAIVGSSGVMKEYGSEATKTLDSPARDTSQQDPFTDLTSEYEAVEPPETIRQVHPEPIPTIPYTATDEDLRPISPLHSVGHYRHNSNLSQSTDPRSGSYQDLSQTSSIGDGRPSEGAIRRGGALSALFRRSGLYKREVPSGQAFSNTSRESMGRHTPSPDMHERTYRRRSSGAPIRTRSKFREDLPDVSPGTGLPSSEGVESTQVPPLPSGSARTGGDGAEPITYQRASYDSNMAPSAALLSQSLASVDSEASWLSGGRSPRKRTSQQMSLGGRSSFARGPSALSGRSTEDLGLYEEPSVRRSYGVEHPSGLGNIGTVMSADDYSEQASLLEEEVNQGTVSRRPTVVHRQARVQSSEGLLRQFSDDSAPVATSTEETDDFDTANEGMSNRGTPVVTTPDQAHPIQQATQAYGLTHARSISAGSAKILDIPARANSKRNSKHTPSPVL